TQRRPNLLVRLGAGEEPYLRAELLRRFQRLPRYPSVPAARLGRLAVDQVYRGRKLGAAFCGTP
ncbi:MAG: hypothetical protein LC647_11470, partial [Beggiatoa sp.]|nr:hypothetical protein [Beggiatoa sp.]